MIFSGMCTVYERVAVLAVNKRSQLITDPLTIHLFVRDYCFLVPAGWSFAFFQKPHCGAFVRIS